MEQSKILGISFSGTSITKNTVYNLLGFGVPMLMAVAIIPLLIKGMGTERFGLLNLSWIVIGYFSFFDFGIGKSLTKIIAEKIGKDDVVLATEVGLCKHYLGEEKDIIHFRQYMILNEQYIDKLKFFK